MGTFLIVWFLSSAVAMIVRDKEGLEKGVGYYLTSVLIGFAVTIPLMILYWLYLASKVLGSGVWVLAFGLLIFGAFKLLFLIFGIGGSGSSSSSHHESSSKSSSSTSTLYHAQVFRHGQWINLGGYYHLSSAYDQAERYAGKGERTRVVDSSGRVQ